jgi:hypothetical protein
MDETLTRERGFNWLVRRGAVVVKQHALQGSFNQQIFSLPISERIPSELPV